jgi:hypothetical protein
MSITIFSIVYYSRIIVIEKTLDIFKFVNCTHNIHITIFLIFSFLK